MIIYITTNSWIFEHDDFKLKKAKLELTGVWCHFYHPANTSKDVLALDLLPFEVQEK